MDIRVIPEAQSEAPIPGGIALEVTLDFDDMAQLNGDAKRALEIERSLPAEARTRLGDAVDNVYIAGFVETRATNDALETYGIVPVAIPIVSTSGLKGGDALYTCRVFVHARPDIGLTSLDPVNLKTSRIPKPGFNASAGKAGNADVEYLDDVKTLRMVMVKRLDGELPETAMRALQHEYTRKFERELADHNIDPETYRLAHSLNEDQYALMMARNALADAHWNYVLDAVFAGMNRELTEQDLLAGYEKERPGYGEQLMELYDLRNETYLMVEKVRRALALDWLLENAIR